MEKKILVVDDESELREILKECFEMEGFQVYEASNGNEAIDLFHKNPCPIVVSDIRMPRGDGIHLLKNIQSERTPIGFFLMSGFSDLSKEEALALGASGLFIKPFDINSLTQQVRQWMEDQKKQKTESL